MDSNTFINAVFLCLVNVIFMIAGLFLNSVVIISLRRSSQLRKKLCYFMILPLSCFDLAVVAIGHSICIFRTVLWYMDKYEEETKLIEWMIVIHINVTGFSMSALLTLSVERFLALKYPFFHQTAVTKRRLVLFLTFLVVITASVALSLFFDRRTYVSATIACLLFVLLLLIYLNYIMYIIAKSKGEGQTITTTHSQQETKKQELNLKQISSCSMAVGCFFICSSPAIINRIFHLISNTFLNDRSDQAFHIWLSTLFDMNSTVNCLIFFWKNSILRREGMKTVKCFQSTRT